MLRLSLILSVPALSGTPAKPKLVALALLSNFLQEGFGDNLEAVAAQIPIVGYTADPVSFGIVTNIAHPNGNITGVSTEAGVELDGKRISLFRDIRPSASKISILAPLGFWDSAYRNSITEYAIRLGYTIIREPLRNPVLEGEFRRVFAVLREQGAEMVLGRLLINCVCSACLLCSRKRPNSRHRDMSEKCHNVSSALTPRLRNG
jgi:putative tryptophan/tyrosine transport system substrate-binding protein